MASIPRPGESVAATGADESEAARRADRLSCRWSCVAPQPPESPWRNGDHSYHLEDVALVVREPAGADEGDGESGQRGDRRSGAVVAQSQAFVGQQPADG